MQKMGKIKSDYLDEYERENRKKRRKYYREELEKIGLDFEVISSTCQKNILNYFENISKEKENIQIINSIKKRNEVFMEIAKNFELTSIDLEIILCYEELIERYSENLEKCIFYNGPKRLLLEYAQHTKSLLFAIYETNRIFPDSIAGQNIILQVLTGNMLSLLENFYFARNIPKDRMLEYCNEFKEFINDTQQKIEEQNKKNINKSTSEASRRILEAFFTNREVLRKMFLSEVETTYDEKFKKLIKTLFEEEIVETTQGDIEFKDVRNEEFKKKDNLFKERIENIKRIINKISHLNRGAILSENKETEKILYFIFYMEKTGVNSVDIKKQKIHTLIKKILEEADEEDKIKEELMIAKFKQDESQMELEEESQMELRKKIQMELEEKSQKISEELEKKLKILNRYIKEMMFIGADKEEIFYLNLELEKMIEKLFMTVVSGTTPKSIDNNLKIVIKSYWELLNKIKLPEE